MKKSILYLLCFVIVALQANGQIFNQKTRTTYEPKREITLRWGIVEYPYETVNNSEGVFKRPSYPWITPLDRYNRGKYLYNKIHYTQALSLSYTQDLKRWLSLSINMSYSGTSQKQKISGSEETTDTYRKHRFSLYPTIRFNYLNKPMVRLYSGIGIGVGMTNEKKFFTNESETDMYLTGQLTLIGVSVGRTLFSTFEIGLGERGVLSAGIGYRF